MTDLEPKSTIYHKALASPGLVSFIWWATIVTLIISFIVAYFKAREGLTTVALHYNIIIGVDLLGKSRDLYLIPLSGLGVAVANYLVFRYAIPKGDFMGLLTALVSWIVALTLCAALLFLYLVN